MYFTYILKCIDDSYYIGSTDNIENRLRDHNNGKGADFTSKRRPCKLVWFSAYSVKSKALQKELELKKFSRKKKEALIFSKDTIWQHYKGNRYVILGQIDEIIIYSDLDGWKRYYKNRKISGKEIQVYARDGGQWLDWIEKDNVKMLRFQRVLAV